MKSTIKITALALLAVATLAGCSKHDDDKTLDTWKGEIRLASGITAQTRAMQDYQSAQLDANNPVGVFINEHGGNTTTYRQNEQYTPNGMGGFITPPTVYFPSSGNPVNIYAYAPRNDNWSDLSQSYLFTVKSNQHSQADYIASDLLWGEPMTAGTNPQSLNPVSRTKDAVSLTFRHLLSKVRVTLKDGAGVTAQDVVKVELLDLFPSTDLKMADGTISAAKGNKGNVTLFDVDNLTITSASAVVVPQTVANGSKFLSFGLKDGGELFYKLPKELTMESGKIYDFNITLNLTGLTVTSTVIDWATGEVLEGDAEMEIPPIGSKKPADAAIGDFYFKDGTLEDKDATLTLQQQAACVGIVFWQGDPTNTTDGDPLLKTQHSGCTHGLVVALHDAGNNSLWSSSYEDITENWLSSQSTTYGITSLKEENKMQGYANTQALIGYNTTSSNVQNNSNLKVLPIEAITTTYASAHPAPASSSGWYFPSVVELKYMCWGQGNSSGSVGRDLLNTQLGKVSGASSLQSDGYWSGAEGGGGWARYVDFYYGGVYGSYKDSRSSGVRAVAAF